ncbi:hypothetical protein AAHA92_26264 [Salvia divinorum]|uniref:SHSP domain-containing protein n=1 Tax=Salvia divinorum TaxID=28513 RepID=A0ABD1GDM6_SALDI
MVESSLCDGPIYFSHISHRHKCANFALSDPDLATSLTLDIKINGSNSSELHGEERVILMFRFHYNVMKRENARLRIGYNFVYESGKTTLCVTKVAESNRVVSSQIYWDRVSLPERWLVEDNLAEANFSEWQRARLDWMEAAGAHVFKVDVPGFKKEEVKVEVEDGGILQISAERSKEEEEESEKWHCKERSSGILRRLRLPESADLDEMKASMENGVLTVTVPKEEVKAKKQVKIIEISG